MLPNDDLWTFVDPAPPVADARPDGRADNPPRINDAPSTSSVTQANPRGEDGVVEAPAGVSEGVTVSDIWKNIRHILDDLNSNKQVQAIVVTDTSSLTISPLEAVKDTVALAKIIGSHTLTVSGTLNDFAALSSAQITQLKQSGFTLDVHDSSLNIQNITARQADALKALGVSALRSDAGSVILNISQAGRLAGAGLTVLASSVTVSDTPANIAKITKASADLMKSLGFTPVGSSSGPVLLSESEASVVAANGIALNTSTLTVAGTLADLLSSPDSLQFWAANSFFIIATDLARLTKADADALKAAKVTAIGTTRSVDLTAEQAGDLVEDGLKIVAAAPEVVVTIADTAHNLFIYSVMDYAAIGANTLEVSDAARLSAQQVGDFESNRITLSGSSITLTDSAAAISGLSVDQLAYLSSLHVTAISSSDGPVSLSVDQAITLETVRIVFEKTSVLIVDRATKIQDLTPEQIASLAVLGVTELASTDLDLKFDDDRSAAVDRAQLVVSKLDDQTVLESYSITASFDYMSGGEAAGTLTLSVDMLTVTEEPAQPGVSLGAGLALLQGQPTENINAGGPDQTDVYIFEPAIVSSVGIGDIQNVNVGSEANLDVLQLAASAFDLTSDSPAAALAQLLTNSGDLGLVDNGAGAAALTDTFGDTPTLGVAESAFETAFFKFA